MFAFSNNFNPIIAEKVWSIFSIGLMTPPFLKHSNRLKLLFERVAKETVPTRANKKYIGGYFDEAIHRQLKILGVETGMTTQDMLSGALNGFFEKPDRFLLYRFGFSENRKIFCLAKENIFAIIIIVITID